MTTPPVTDQTQQITADDPRVAQILALIRAKQQPIPTDPSAPLTAQIQPVSPPVAPQFTPTQAQTQPPSPLQQQVQQQQSVQQLPAPPQSNLPPMSGPAPNLPPETPPQVQQGPGPVKGFLQRLLGGLGSDVYAGSQAAYQKLGIPTDYEKQQNALKIGLQQQQQNSLEGLRNAQQGLYEGKGAQLDQMTAPYTIAADDASVLPQFRGQPTTFGGYQALQKLSGVTQGKQDVADTNAASRQTVAQLRQQIGTKFQHVSGTSGGKDVFANYDPASGRFTDQAGNVLSDFSPTSKANKGAFGSFGSAFMAYRMYDAALKFNPAILPAIAPMISKILGSSGANSEGLEGLLAAPPAGQPRDDAGNPIGLSQPGSPTGATRSRGQFAEAVIPSITIAKNQIQQLGSQLGPMAGRWNDLYTSKVGAYGPQFSGLQTNLKNIGTAWMRLHANSEGARVEFQQMLSSAKDPANLAANLDAIQQQAHDYVLEGKGRPGALAGAASKSPPPGATATVPGSDGKMHYTDGKKDLGVVQ